MTAYEFHGSIRIEANSADQALDVLDEMRRTNQIEDYHINDWEEL
jgi:hypothetical protein